LFRIASARAIRGAAESALSTPRRTRLFSSLRVKKNVGAKSRGYEGVV
jgi:hypothetical protein